ncbi:MAG: UDP-N-acetylglucosamine 2-epimerase (non-hydrolyzing) [Hyphomicrobiaceae bacterium]
MTQTVLVVFGTRPEAIKMLPVAKALMQSADIDCRICVTAQHREMLDQVLQLFAVTPDYDLNIMTHAQGLENVTSAVLDGLSQIIDEVAPDRILVHGDTTTTMAATLAAFYKNVPVGHVEAGLRSGDIMQPWPEEMNRRVTDVMADQLYAPTASSRANLLKEGVAAKNIFVTGNTVIDALLQISQRIEKNPVVASQLADHFDFLDPDRAILLVTGHRRENFGAPFLSLCEAIRDLALQHPIQVVYPVHLNPNVQSAVRKVLSDIKNVHLIKPQDYLPFVYLMKRAHVILTDSGGIQEEAPALGKPVFVMRNVTERPEAVEAGTVRLVGTDREQIVSMVSDVLSHPASYQYMSRAHNPYGDGHASQRILEILLHGQTSEFSE